MKNSILKILLSFILIMTLTPSSSQALVDSDGDGLSDEAEKMVWNTDPLNKDTDGDGYDDLFEIQNGYDPLVPLKPLDPIILTEKKLAMNNLRNLQVSQLLETDQPNKELFAGVNISSIDKDDNDKSDSITNSQVEHEVYRYFSSEDQGEYNYFEEKNGLFNFAYRNTLELKIANDIYYLEDLVTKEIAFHIFVNRPTLNFADADLICRIYKGDNKLFQDKEICFSQNNNENEVINLELFADSDYYFQKKLNNLFQLNAIDDVNNFDRYGIFNRAETVAMALRLKYPDKDFDSFKNDCFDDVTKGNPYSGYICFAKGRNIINGIGNKFYPQQGINLWGLLKILFVTFEIKDYKFDDTYFDPILFTQMSDIHASYELIAKGLYEGLFNNYTNETLWSNRVLFKDESIDIISNFLVWRQGKKIRSYNSDIKNYYQVFINTKDNEPLIIFNEQKNNDFLNEFVKPAKFLQTAGGVEIYMETNGNIFEYLYTLPEAKIADLQGIVISFDNDRFEGRIKITYKDDSVKVYKSEVKKKQFTVLKENYEKTKSKYAKIEIFKRNLLPNKVESIANPTIPQIKIYLSDSDLENIFVNRTSDKRYKAHLELIYPDGKTEERSIVIKTRGNASRGYVKSSFTVESFKNFDPNKNFNGDGFLHKQDEFKLRSFINEDTMIAEKLFYTTAKKMGLVAPDFFEALVQINGIEMGLYQVTEPIKKEFFKRRGINTDSYYYARNSGSIYDTNLKFHKDNQTTLAQYKIRGSEKMLLDFIIGLDKNDQSLLEYVDVENVLTYGLLVFLSNAKDSLTHNFYVYFDVDNQKWKMFPWDADDSFDHMPDANVGNFIKFGRNNRGLFNNLINYAFKNTQYADIQLFFDNFMQRWQGKVDLVRQINGYEEELKTYFEFDNRLWNGKFLERKNPVVNTLQAISKLKENIVQSGFSKTD